MTQGEANLQFFNNTPLSSESSVANGLSSLSTGLDDCRLKITLFRAKSLALAGCVRYRVLCPTVPDSLSTAYTSTSVVVSSHDVCGRILDNMSATTILLPSKSYISNSNMYFRSSKGKRWTRGAISPISVFDISNRE